MSQPIKLQARVLGAENVVRRLQGAPGRVRSMVQTTVKQLGAELQRKVMQDKLTGQVLRVRSGRLRRSINLRINDQGDEISASVGTNVSYARRHEKGGQWTENVRAHQRKVRLALNKDGSFKTQHQRSGVYGPGTASMTRLLVFAKKGVKNSIGGVFMVKAHTRTVNVKRRSFMMSSLGEMRQTIRARLLAAMNGGI